MLSDNPKRTYKIFISAADPSANVHGAQLVRAFKKIAPVHFFGMTGTQLQAEGVETWVDAKDLAVMGFTEVLPKLPKILNALKVLVQKIKETKPDAILLLDYPDFHFRLVKKISNLGIPIIYYIPPVVWAWRTERADFLAKYFSKVLCIYPFEESFLKEKGVKAHYVGHPLQEELDFDMTRAEARKSLNLSESEKVLLLMPGSRKVEYKMHLDLMLDAANKAAAQLRSHHFLSMDQRLKVLIPISDPHFYEKISKKVSEWVKAASGGNPKFILDVQVSSDPVSQCMKAADVGLIKSGTSTLEAALMGCPHSIIYKPKPLSCFIIQKIYRYKKPAGIVNWILGVRKNTENKIREIICGDVTVESVAQEIFELFTSEEKKSRLKTHFQEISKTLFISENPSEKTAHAILEVIS